MSGVEVRFLRELGVGDGFLRLLGVGRRSLRILEVGVRIFQQIFAVFVKSQFLIL